MDQRNDTDLPASLSNGRLEGVSVPDLLWNLCRRRSTGVLHLTAQRITKKVYIDEGRIIFALSGDPDDRLGDRLLREDLITLDQLESALSQISSGKRLGTLLVDAGYLSPDNLVRGVLNQVKGIVLALFPWEEGEYAFVEGPLPTDEVITLGIRTSEILLQGIRQVRSFTRIRKSVGPTTTRFRLRQAWHEVVDGLEIRDGERMLLQRLDEAGAPGMTVDAMCREVFLSNFEIYQALWAFLVLGIVQVVEHGPAPVIGSATGGRLEGASLPEMLVRLCRSEVTGVLYMTRGALERSLHINQGQIIFATSNALDDGLVAHLLRRGVISLSDREETARRLLSNKRVGTILLELGVIDESDLCATVREQLSEVIFDTFRWERGDFQFLPGDLPTIEEITLTRTVEELVYAGVRRVTSWSRVREGLGGLGARLVLLPEYLTVLDKMTVGPEEWELISLLKTPKTVYEICRESMLGDFRSCQILWALRLLGGVGEAPVEVSVDSALERFDPRPAVEPVFADAFETHDSPSEPVPEPAVEPGVATEPELAMEPAPTPDPDPTPLPVSEADSSAEVVSEPWRLAAERPSVEPQLAAEPQLPEEPGLATEPELAMEPAPTPDPDPTPRPVSDADSSAEVVSEPWRLAAERPPADLPTEPRPVAFQFDSPADATVAMSREEVEAALRDPEDGLPRFELGEPGTSHEDMKVDMCPTALPALKPDATEAKDADSHAPGLEGATPARRSVPSDRRAVDSWEEDESGTSEPAFEPPPNLDGAIASFNARHVHLFRTLRVEIGAGAANFVRSCRGGLQGELAAMFEAAELRSDGSWDPERLKRLVIEHRMANADEGFRRLLDAELGLLRAHLGDARIGSLADQLASIR